MARPHPGFPQRATAIVVAGAVLACAAVTGPDWWRERQQRATSASEYQVMSALKRVSSAIAQTTASGAIDFDGDGIGEAGFFGEMAGVVPVVSGRRVAKLEPPVLPPEFAALTVSGLRIGDYRLRFWIPSRDGTWVTEGAAGERPPTADPDRAEKEWICYAWPATAGGSLRRSFLIDHRGDILSCRGDTHAYGGADEPVPGRAGFLADAAGRRLATNELDALGDFWVATP